MTTGTKPSRSGQARSPNPADESGSMAILLMVVLVGLMLGALLVPMIVTQQRTTRFDISRLDALNAAQAGIDVTLGAIRASVTDGIGVSGRLPCGPESGTVNGAGVATYSVIVEYFTFDPAAEPLPSTAAMQCIPGYGTFDASTGATTPRFARFTSTGTTSTVASGGSGGRTLVSTYIFRTPDANLLGGLVQTASPAASVALCMDAGSANPPAGAAVLLGFCSSLNPPAAQQVFAYRSDLTLQLLSSITAASPNGLCLNSASTPAVSGDPIRLTPCGPLGVPAAYTQQWSYNDNGQYQAAQANSATTGALPDLCMNAAAQMAGQSVILGRCGSEWIPSPSVGPGAAARPQWINFSEFGRCMDVTAQDIDHAFLIAYPCKQNPFPAAKAWNQLFEAPAIPPGQASVSGQISTLDAQKCLTSPGIDGGYVTVKTCASDNARQTWSIHGGDSTLDASTKYTVVNGSMCLGLGPPNAQLPAWSTIVVQTCTGAPAQKWNAAPDVLRSALVNTYER